MKRIEDRFQALAEELIAGAVSEIAAEEKSIINVFYALWHVRARNRKLAEQEVQTSSLTGTTLCKDQEENLEANGYMFSRSGGTIPARQINGIEIQRRIYRDILPRLSDARWGIIRAHEGQFVVPDVPVHTVVPLAPTLCLVSPASNGTILNQNVVTINQGVMEASQEYFFANEFGPDLASRISGLQRR